MLVSLSIRNVVLIEKLDLSFDKGLCVFTGETGAGKSILLDALSLALGARAETELIRYGADQLSVTAEFTIDKKHPALQILSEQGLDTDTTLILRRTLTKDGKSKAFVNDQPISVGLLKEIGNTLVEIHGQFASHSLLNPANHLPVLDNYGGLTELVETCRQLYEDWRNKKALVIQAAEILQKAKADEEYLTHAVKELEALAPQKGEEEKLSTRRTELMNAEKITESLNNAYMILSSGSNSTVQSMIHSAARELEKANRFTDGSFDEILKTLDLTADSLAEAVESLEEQSANFSDPGPELEQLEDRLFTLKDIARKHRVAVDDLPETLLNFKAQLNTLYKGEEELIMHRKAAEQARLDFITKATELSKARHKAAEQLDKAVREELPALKLNKAHFETRVEELPESDFSATGMNRITFCVSTNNGVPPAPLNKVASGGELARFMLALKVNLAGAENIPTLIFDEVDSGIGGATASAVGERLRRLGQERQVLVVTHSPQVAAFGTEHMNVTKETTADNHILTTVIPLTAEKRLEEIARMLSGAEITDQARLAAQTLLEKSCL